MGVLIYLTVRTIQIFGSMAGGLVAILGNWGFGIWGIRVGWDILAVGSLLKKKNTFNKFGAWLVTGGLMLYLAMLVLITTSYLSGITRTSLGGFWSQIVEATSLTLGYEIMKKLLLRENKNTASIKRAEFLLSYLYYSLGGVLIYMIVTGLIYLLVK